MQVPFLALITGQALQSVFKGRGSDARGREGAIERCDVSIQDQPDKTECRLIVKMICKNGIVQQSYASMHELTAFFRYDQDLSTHI